MVSIAIVGGQWGDEGKAKITDLLSAKADCVIRYQGGANAGHTVMTPAGHFKFHLIPSGILFPETTSIIGPGTVIDPKGLWKEMQGLLEKNISLNNLRISGLAHLILPWHIDIDKATDQVGSTGKGIGPAYTDKAKRIGLQLFTFLDRWAFRDALEKSLAHHSFELERLGLSYDLDQVEREYLEVFENLKAHVADTIQELHEARKAGKTILFEGAQGTLLDISFGTYPYVTSSTPISGGACIGSGVGPAFIDYSLGVFKSFITRVGGGPFPSEIEAERETAQKLRQDGTLWAEYGTTTGRMRRVGWFDAVLARYSVRVNSFQSIAVTKLDTLDAFEKIMICTSYRDKRTGWVSEDIPCLNASWLSNYEPIFEEFPGWLSNTHGCNDIAQLPANAKLYLDEIARRLGVPVSIVSTGPQRADSIILHDPTQG